MPDMERDFWPEPLRRCRICEREIPEGLMVYTDVCQECYWELADEFPNGDEHSNDCEKEE